MPRRSTTITGDETFLFNFIPTSNLLHGFESSVAKFAIYNIYAIV
jgi:hypothetical protein